ncbi:MAG: hypothetical protein NC432_10375 [Roseburia sp.]|nr:hypothetical protein [Roseburia sp.]MCM1097103.1 hypothetical protein [Ruminococcus flavefaciens]
MQREVYWHLPGFCYFRLLNQVVINLMKDYPHRFREGYRVGSVYGTFPGAIWNGGRAVFGITGKSDIESILKTYNSRNIPVRFTWTNSLLEKKHLTDTYCNLIMRLGDNGLNQVLVNTPVLEDYIRREYPNYKRISSTTKRITDLGGLKAEFEKDYSLVVLDYDLNHDEAALQAIEPYAERTEILVNEVCYPGCPKRVEHYRQQSQMQLEFDVNTAFPCPNHTREQSFKKCMERPAFISNEQIGDYIDRGFVNFKIAGRGMPQDYVEESYLYFLVKDEDRDFIRGKIDGLMRQFATARQANRNLQKRN